MWATRLWEHDWLVWQWAIAFIGALLGAVSDLRTRKIPNALTASMFLGGLVWAGWLAGIGGVGESLGGALLAAGPFLVLFVLGGGAGDAKLMGAVGAWLGVHGGLLAMVTVVIAGAVIALGYAIVRRRLKSVGVNMGIIAFGAAGSLIGGPGARQAISGITMERLPYGPAIALGVGIAAVIALVQQGQI